MWIGMLVACAMLAQDGAPTPKKDRSLGYDDTPYIPGQQWRVHDVTRPRPAKVAPAAEIGKPPADAVVLFDGTDLSQWVMVPKGAREPVEPNWKVENGYMEVTPRSGALRSKEKFGDCQLHVEWFEPTGLSGKSQAAGNSGIILMGRYEIQVLESYYNETYADGQAAAIYGQWPPMVNASRPPGQWQSYDIFFEAPRFEGDKLVRPAFVTVLHNGILVHHHQAFTGPMAHARALEYKPHGSEEPLVIQDHGNPIRFRNIWVRRLMGYDRR
jgi:hypothetical protein